MIPIQRTFHDRRRSLAPIALLALLALAAAGAPASAAKADLEGAWLVTVALDNPPPGVPPRVLSLRTYTSDGQVIESGAAQAIRSTGHGEWRKAGSRKYDVHFAFFRFDPANGSLMGVQYVDTEVRLGKGRDAFTATASFDLIDLAGNVIFHGTASETGERLPSAD